MDFKKATDGLFDRVEHEDLARTLGVSIASIRQARLNPEAKAFRAPPPNWKEALIRLAERRAAHYQRLAAKLRHDSRPTAG